MKKIHWISEGSSDERGYWKSTEGRFSIAPDFRHTVNPDSYTITDYMAKTSYLDHKMVHVFEKRTFDTVRECKQHAVEMIS